MDKKEIYEHLAKIYLDASSTSSKKRKKRKSYPEILKKISFIVVLMAVISAISLGFFVKSRPFNSEVALILLPDVAKINFHFDPARKETYSLNLNNLNINRYKTLAFSVRNVNYNDTIAMRVEFTNAFKEKSEVYVKDLPHKWKDYRIEILEFRNISDWSEMSNLTFAVEEWNSREKKGVVYIDNVRLLK